MLDPSHDLPTLLTTHEAAKLARVDVATVRDWIASGKLAAAKPGRRHLIRRTDLLQLVGLAKPARVRKERA